MKRLALLDLFTRWFGRKRELPPGYKLTRTIQCQFKWCEWNVCDRDGRIISTGDTQREALEKFRTSTKSGGGRFSDE